MELEKKIDKVFAHIEYLTIPKQCESLESQINNKVSSSIGETTTHKEDRSGHPLQWKYVEKLIEAVLDLLDLIKDDESILISVKNQKHLRCCYQLITSMGLLPCLIPGVGIGLNKRSENCSRLPQMRLDDTQKYTLLKLCTDFFISSYNVPILRKIIVTMHMADYLAALMQLSYAPLKKPGAYDTFTMTQDLYDQLQADNRKYVLVFENLVSTCFQPMIMKELLVLQSGTDPAPPLFLKRVTNTELSNRLLAPGGLVSLIRCFIESPSIDVALEWKKVDMIRRIVATKHGSLPDEHYLGNICRQLKEIISSSNIYYYSTAVACVFHLWEKHPQSAEVEKLADDVLKCFDIEHLEKKISLPGTVLLTSQEVEHKINVLHSLSTTQINESSALLSCNLYVLFLIRLNCSKCDEMKAKLNHVIVKHLEDSNSAAEIKQLLFGLDCKLNMKISVEEYGSGMVLKSVSHDVVHPTHQASKYFIELLKETGNMKIAGKVFEVCLDAVLAYTEQRKRKANRNLLIHEEEPELIDAVDATYAVTLQLLEELCTIPKVLSFIKNNPECIIKFIENILLKDQLVNSDECVTIATVLLHTLLSESDDVEALKMRCSGLLPVLRQMCSNVSDNSFLANEILTMITDVKSPRSNKKSEFQLVISNVFDNLLPVRAHGLIELTKLIEKNDPETLSKKHYVMCLFQEQLKDDDSYIYLSAINGIAALCRHSTEDVLNVLCKEFLEASVTSAEVETAEVREKRDQLRLKVGDVIVKVTKSLGELAVVHKALLLNTVLCACRDDDPLIRTSALSNLAEISLVLHYRMGTILYEILLCICSVLETDKSPECRRAAVMVISSLLKGLGKETLLQLQDTLLPVYRTLKQLYRNPDEDSIVRLHAQIALEELNDIVKEFIHKLDMERKIVITDLDKKDIQFK